MYYSFEEGRGGRLIGDTPPIEQLKRPLITWDSDSEQQFNRTMTEISDIYPGCVAEIYLRNRNIDKWPHSFKNWGNKGICYIAQIKDGTPYACQLVPLTYDGKKNKNFWADGITRRTYALVHGWQNFAAVRFPGRGELILCEGPETAASVWIATGRPVVACLGVCGFQKLRTGTKRVTIARDGDKPESPADKAVHYAVEVRKRFQRVKLATPPEGTDFNQLEINEIKKIIRNAENC